MKRTIQQAALIALGILVFAASGVMAEDNPTLERGSKVRVTVLENAPADSLATSDDEAKNAWIDDSETETVEKSRTDRLEGTLLYVDETMITLETSPGSPPVQILRQDLSKLEMYKGKKSRGTGALMGFGIGAGFGAIFGYAQGDDPDGFVSFSAGENAAIGAVLFSVVGAIIGTVITPGDKWETVPENRMHLDFQIDEDGAREIYISFLF